MNQHVGAFRQSRLSRSGAATCRTDGITCRAGRSGSTPEGHGGDQTIWHSGASSLRLENILAGEITQVSRNLPIGHAGLRAGGTYRLSAWCRTERLERPAAINIGVLARDLKSRGSWKLPFPEPGDWQEVSTDVVVPVEGAEMLRVMIHVDGPCRVWVDDFRVMEVDAQGTVRPIVCDGLPSQHQLYKQWIELYHGDGRPYLQHGVAIPPPTEEPTGAVKVGAFRAADGSEAVIAVNATDKTQQATLRWNDKSKRVELTAFEVKLIPR